jgi:hypothetical protein
MCERERRPFDVTSYAIPKNRRAATANEDQVKRAVGRRASWYAAWTWLLIEANEIIVENDGSSGSRRFTRGSLNTEIIRGK